MRDQYQRNSLERGYRNCDPDDLIMISDIDEIPDPYKIKEEFDVKKRYACLIQKNFQSKLNLLNITDKNWPGTKICQKKYLKSPQWLRNLKTKKGHLEIFKDKEPQLIKDGGWHLVLKEPSLIKKKIISYSHQEFNKPEFIDEKNIRLKIDRHEDLFNRNMKYKVIEVDRSFPEYIVNNQEILKEWII